MKYPVESFTKISKTALYKRVPLSNCYIGLSPIFIISCINADKIIAVFMT